MTEKGKTKNNIPIMIYIDHIHTNDTIIIMIKHVNRTNSIVMMEYSAGINMNNNAVFYF